MTNEQLKEHRAKLMAKAAAYDVKMAKFSYTITDVTPAGYGPTESNQEPEPVKASADPVLVNKLRSSVAEGKTILLGKISGARREAVERSVAASMERLAAIA